MKKKRDAYGATWILYQPQLSVGLTCPWQIIFISGIYFNHWTTDLRKGRDSVYTLSARREKAFRACHCHIVNCKSHLLSLLWKYRKTLMTHSWVILFRLPNFFPKRSFSIKLIVLWLVEMKAACIVCLFHLLLDFMVFYSLSPVSVLACISFLLDIR